jgi:hypothetical protein
MAHRRQRSLAIVGCAAAGLLAATSQVAAAGGWTIVPVPQPTSHGYLVGVDARSDADAWGVGTSIIGTPGAWPQPIIDHWNGSAWQALPTPVLGNGQHILNAVSASSANDAWAVGYQGTQRYQWRMLALHWNGTAWSANSPTDFGPFDARLVGVADLGPNNAFAIGDSSSLATGAIEHWNGSTWARATLPDPDPASPGHPTTLVAISADSPSDAWAVGTYLKDVNGTLVAETYTLHWNGSAWSVVYMPLEPPTSPSQATFVLNGITALSPSDVWAVGESGPNVNSNGAAAATLTEHWNGSAWSVVPSPSPNVNAYLNGVTARASNDVWTVGFMIPSYGVQQTLTEHWDGASWTIVASPNVGSTSVLSSVSTRPGASLIWAVGRSGNSTTTYQPLGMDHT